MKYLSLFTLILIVITSFISCNNINTANPDFIIGKWKNSSNPNNEIEFKKSGEYITWINGVSSNDSLKDGMKPFKFIYNPSAKDYNLIISDNLEGDTLPHQEKLEIIDENKIKISLFINDKVFSIAEFSRVN